MKDHWIKGERWKIYVFPNLFWLAVFMIGYVKSGVLWGVVPLLLSLVISVSLYIREKRLRDKGPQ